MSSSVVMMVILVVLLLVLVLFTVIVVKLTKFIKVQSEMTQNNNVDVNEIVSQVVAQVGTVQQPIQAEEISNDIEQNNVEMPSLEVEEPEVMTNDEVEEPEIEEPEIEEIQIEEITIDDSQEKESKLKIPTLDEAETAELLQGFAKKPKQVEEDITTQELNTLFDKVEVFDGFDEMPEFTEVEQGASEEVQAILDKLQSIREQFNQELSAIQIAIAELKKVDDVNERTSQKAVLKERLMALKLQIVEFRELESEVKSALPN